MTTVELKSNATLQQIVYSAVPSYRLDNVFVSAFKRFRVHNFVWVGDSRAEYRLINLETLEIMNVQRGSTEIRSIPSGYVLVKAGVYMGGPSVAHVYFNPEDASKFVKEDV